jgi:hypothetical protein
LSADSIAGAFSNVPNGGRLSTADGGSFRVNYGPGSAFAPTLVVLSAFQATGLPGDFDRNGIVDSADYVVWRKNPSAFGGDPAGYNTWRVNFGRVAGGSSIAESSAAAVPEPMSLALLVFAALLGMRRCPRTGRSG